MADILARGLAITAQETADTAQAAVEALPNGLVYKGAVDYYNDLPSRPKEGDTYTVKYEGTSGQVEDGREFGWGKYDGIMQWIELSPKVSAVGKSGEYTDLKNKPDLSIYEKKSEAFSGDYNDLENKPTIPTVPTDVSAFNNDAGYLTQHQDISGKQDTLIAGENITIAADGKTISASGGGSASSPRLLGISQLYLELEQRRTIADLDIDKEYTDDNASEFVSDLKELLKGNKSEFIFHSTTNLPYAGIYPDLEFTHFKMADAAGMYGQKLSNYSWKTAYNLNNRSMVCANQYVCIIPMGNFFVNIKANTLYDLGEAMWNFYEYRGGYKYYDNSTSGLSSSTIKEAIDELAAKYTALEARVAALEA